MIVVLVLLGQVLEFRSRARSMAALAKLRRLTPKTARVIDADGRETERELAELERGQSVRVRPGELIPIDGIVLDGETTVDESAFDGEPLRASRSPGSTVLAGSANGLGTITVEVVHVRGETVLDKIIDLVGHAQRGRAPLQRLADRVIAWIVPFALLLAVVTVALWVALGPPDSLALGVACGVGVLVELARSRWASRRRRPSWRVWPVGSASATSSATGRRSNAWPWSIRFSLIRPAP